MASIVHKKAPYTALFTNNTIKPVPHFNGAIDEPILKML
jgi:hypothetical protein